jgi:hypothetical protein
MISSTSTGAGMTHVPVPHLLLILSLISTTLGRSLLSASFSCHDFGFLALILSLLSHLLQKPTL